MRTLSICSFWSWALHFLYDPVNSELRLAILNFLSILASIVPNLFLIYNQKYCYASFLNKLLKFFLVSRSWEL